MPDQSTSSDNATRRKLSVVVRGQLPVGDAPASTTSSVVLHGLLFKLRSHALGHVFDDVRFVDSRVPEADRNRVVQFLQGRVLEQLTPRMLARELTPLSCLVALQEYVLELQALFCD